MTIIELSVEPSDQTPFVQLRSSFIKDWLTRTEISPEAKIRAQMASQSRILVSSNSSSEQLIESRYDPKDGQVIPVKPTEKWSYDSSYNDSLQLQPNRDIYDYHLKAKVAAGIEGPICKAVKECRAVFERVLGDGQDSAPAWVMTQYGQFNIWAFGIKADVKGKKSLDEQVKSSTETVDSMLTLLHGIIASLCGYLDIRNQGTADSSPPSKKRRADPKSDSDIIEPATHDVEKEEAGCPLDDSSVSERSSSSKGLGDLGYLMEEMHSNLVDTLQKIRRLTAAIRESGTRHRYLAADSKFNLQEHFHFCELLTRSMESDISLARVEQEQGKDIAEEMRKKRRTRTSNKLRSQLIKLNALRRHRILYLTAEARRLSSVPALWDPSREIMDKKMAVPEKPQDIKQHTQSMTSSIKKRKASELNAWQPPSERAITASTSSFRTATETRSVFNLETYQAALAKQSAPSVVTLATTTGANETYPKCPKPITKGPAAGMIQCQCCASLISGGHASNRERWR